MDEQLASLQEEVKLKDALIEQLTSSVASLTTKLEVMEKAASINSHRMGKWLHKKSCLPSSTRLRVLPS